MAGKKTIPDPAETEALQHDFARLRATLESMKDRLGDNAHDVLERVSSYLDKGNFGARLDNMEDELTRLGGRLKESGRDAAHKLETEVTAKPLTSVAVAFGIGLLAASLLRRH